MCADGVNFGDYLVRNEKWLTTGNETPDTKEVDGKLSDNEISIFFSNSHINTDGDGEISSEEFNNWYSANSEAITDYLSDIGADYNDSDVKASMLASMNEFMKSSTYSDVELVHLNEDIQDLTLGEMGMPTNEQVSESQKQKEGENAPQANQYSEAAQFYYDSMENLYNNKGSLDESAYQDKVKTIINNIINDYNIESSEKLTLIENISKMENEITKEALSKDDLLYSKALADIVSDDNYKIEDVIELTTRYNALQGETDIKPTTTVIDNILKVTEKAAAVGKLKDLLNAGFTKPSDLAKMVQENKSSNIETNYLKRIMNAIGGYNNSTNYENYGLNEDQVDSLREEYREYNTINSHQTTITKLNQRDTMYNILDAYQNGKLDKNSALFLLQDTFGGDLSSLIDKFRSFSNGNQEALIGTLFEIYT